MRCREAAQPSANLTTDSNSSSSQQVSVELMLALITHNNLDCEDGLRIIRTTQDCISALRMLGLKWIDTGSAIFCLTIMLVRQVQRVDSTKTSQYSLHHAIRYMKPHRKNASLSNLDDSA